MRERIIEIIESRLRVSFKELAILLNVDDTKELHQCLDGLLAENMIIDDEEGRLCSLSCFERGVVHHYRDHYYVYLNNERHYLDNGAEFYLMDKDEVLYGNHQIIKVLKRNTKFLIFELYRKGKKFAAECLTQQGHYYFTNLDDFRFKGKCKALAEIVSYRNKEVKILKLLDDTLESDIDYLLYTNFLKLEFKKDIYREIEELDWDTSLEHNSDYLDYTNYPLVTIDGESAKDFDDAICIIKEKDNYKLLVAIADVSSYVIEKSKLDNEAFKRGTSVYYLDKVIPMLPFALSSDLCSLKEDCLRKTLVVEMVYDGEANLINTKINKGIIKNHKRLTYTQVNNLFENNENIDIKIDEMLKKGLELSRLLQKKYPSLSFKTREHYFEIYEGHVFKLELRKDGLAENMIESFMIEANCAVASLMSKNNLPAIYRNHQEPKYIDKEYLHYYLEDLDIELDRRESLFALLKEHEDDYALNNYLLRSMARARYSPDNLGHYALGKAYYCHFTSPIRRYPDLLVHRYLHQYYFNKAKINKIDLEYQAQQCNLREEAAVKFEREVDALLCCDYYEPYLNQIFEAVVCSIKDFGIFVCLDDGVEGMISTRHNNFYTDEDEGYFEYQNQIFNIGSRLKVRLIEVDRIKREISFKIKL